MDADAVVQIARKTQVNDAGRTYPVSLINIWSPLGLLPTGPEKHLRSLAVEVAAELPDDSSSMDALKHVFEKLRPFKVESFKIEQKWRKLITTELAKLEVTGGNGGDLTMDMLVCYHSMLWKTGHGWTYRRTPKEMNIKSGYLPAVLNVFADATHMDTRLSNESLETLDLRTGQVDEELAAVVGGYDDWKQIGVMEFFASTLTLSKPLLGPTSQNTVRVNVGDGNRWGCVPAQQDAIDRGEQSWTNTYSEDSFTMTPSPKMLYDIRPQAIERMVFAQFVAQYRLLERSGRETDDAEKQLSPGNTVGPPSDTPIAGTAEMAPTLVRFSNSRIYKKRMHEEGNRLPIATCMDQTLDDRTKRYLFKPWREPENVMKEVEFDADVLKSCDEVRLELYPTSCLD